MKLAAAALLGAGSIMSVNVATSEGGPATETERGFRIHTQTSAPEPTREVLDWYQENFEFVPHLAGVMAESPALARSYWQLQTNLNEFGTLTPAEDNVAQMSIAVDNRCQYCVAGHTMAGMVFFGSSDAELAALRQGERIPGKKLNALRDFALRVYETQGRVSDSDLHRFYDAGYTRANALDVVANVAAKVMSNYTNQIALTPLDEPLVPLAEGLPYGEDRKVIER